MGGTLEVEDLSYSRNEKHEASADFSDDHSLDAGIIDYDGFGNDSSCGDQSYRRPSKVEKPMLDKKISNTFRWKLFVILLMIVNTTIVVIGTRLFLDSEENKEFEKMFNIAAMTIVDATHYHLESITDSMETLGETITSYCLDTGAEWPFVTIPGFEQRVGTIRRSSLLNLMGFLPLVETAERELWEAYAEREQGWIQDSYKALFSSTVGDNFTDPWPGSAHGDSTAQHNNQHGSSRFLAENHSISPTIVVTAAGQLNTHPGEGPYAPVWQMSPPPPPSMTTVINTDLMSIDSFHLLLESFRRGQAVSTFAITHAMPTSLYSTIEPDNETWPQNASSLSLPPSASFAPEQPPSSFLFRPIFSAHDLGGEIQGFAIAVLSWQEFFSSLLPDEIKGIMCVLHNPCDGQSYTFQLHGRTATFLGDFDMHENEYDHVIRQTVLTEAATYGVVFNESNGGTTKVSSCHFAIDIYASAEFSSEMHSNGPLIFTLAIACVFIGTGVVFLAYVYIIGNRQNKVLAVAASTSAIVSSLFPSTVRDRMLREAEAEVRQSDKSKRGPSTLNGRRQTMKHIQEGRQTQNERKKRSKPNADLFPETTVLFADIVGFTAWSSVRDPTQVFELLETIYHSFDQIAKRRRVFKVETIGDCYVAVTGLPQPCRDHAVNMCRFARDCLHVMEILTKKLEAQLGPDTGELSMRFGLHSGPVTAGVLRGERSRFQLFGDTVNTAARMESNGEREKIHISEQTAEQLIKAGKEDWFSARADKIIAKGKGELQTYWLHTKKCSMPMSDVSNSEDGSLDLGDWLELPTELFDSQRSKMGLGTNEIRQCLSEQNQRLADWNSNQLVMLLNNVVSHRKAVLNKGIQDSSANDGYPESEVGNLGNPHAGVGESGGVLKDVADTIEMPRYDGKVFVAVESTAANLSEIVQQQLHDFVSILCSLYVDHPFHNYQHASHVTMSIIKLLSSLSNPHHSTYFKDDNSDKTQARNEKEGERFHSKTFGISSDPMTRFALAFASLIHDVDHPGVPNSQLVKENSRLARVFGNRCIAEQNSFQCSWDLLMDPSFTDLRAAIYTTKEEFHHFRQLVVNAVVSTDLFDKELNEERQRRWDLAFPPSSDAQEVAAPESSKTGQKDLEDRQATVVIEYMVQASDVAHTMQHWHVYRKWNERLFHEQLKSYRAGRLENDPCEFWYTNELDFFDNTVIPMAKKLKSCGAFQVYFDEYLSYATQNRQEWELKGHAIVNEMYQTFEALAMAALSSRDDTTTLRDDLDDDPFTKQH